MVEHRSDACCRGGVRAGWSWEVGHAWCPRPESARSSTSCMARPEAGDHPPRGRRAGPPDRTAHRRRGAGGGRPRDRLHPELRHRRPPRGDRRTPAAGGRTVLRRRRDRRSARVGCRRCRCRVRRAPRRRRRGAAARSGVAELRDDGGAARCRRSFPTPLPASNGFLPDVDQLRAPDHRSHPADRASTARPTPRVPSFPADLVAVDRRARCRARPVGPVRRGVRRARLRGRRWPTPRSTTASASSASTASPRPIR